MKEILHFGILGCGMIAHIHADALRQLPQAALYGVFDPAAANAQSFADSYHVTAYPDYETMLQDPQIDIVCICTPSGFHADAAIKALNAGKHVVLEKPMALSLAEADAIIEATRQSGCLLTVISQLRFSEEIKQVKKMVEDNVFGKLIFCDLSMKFWRDPSYYSNSNWKGTFRFDGGGALMNQGIHGVDLLLYIAGEASVINGKIKTITHNIEVEDTAAVVLSFENGALGTIKASTCTYPGFERRIEINGDRGFVHLRENRIEKLMIDGQILIDRKAEDFAENKAARDASALDSSLHMLQIQNLISTIHGETPLLIDAAEGRKAVKLILDIYQSSGNQSFHS